MRCLRSLLMDVGRVLESVDSLGLECQALPTNLRRTNAVAPGGGERRGIDGTDGDHLD